MQALLDQPFGRTRAQSPFPAPQQGHPPSTPAPASLPAATAASVHGSHSKPTPFTPAAAAFKRADEQGVQCVCRGFCVHDVAFSSLLLSGYTLFDSSVPPS